MNKLEIALKLLHLLNERKDIDSKIVASELNVSLRTAQRYLMELSALPCVTNQSNSHTYTLNTEYELKKALRSPGEHKAYKEEDLPSGNLNQTVCLICANARKHASTMSGLFDNRPVSNKHKLDKLASMISKSLKHNRCGFP
jgi:hypothetical protein